MFRVAVAAFTLFTVANGFVIYNGTCPNITFIPNSELSEIGGTMFAVNQTRSLSSSKCIQYTFTGDSEGNYTVVRVGIDQSSNVPTTETLYFQKSTTPDHNFDVQYQGYIFRYYVIRERTVPLGTTPVTLILVSCNNIGNGQSLISVLILKVVPCISTSEYQEYVSDLRRCGVPQVVIDQTGPISHVQCLVQGFTGITGDILNCRLRVDPLGGK